MLKAGKLNVKTSNRPDIKTLKLLAFVLLAPPVKSNTTNNETLPKKVSVGMFGAPEKLVAQNNYTFDELLAHGRKQNPMWSDTDLKY